MKRFEQKLPKLEPSFLKNIGVGSLVIAVGGFILSQVLGIEIQNYWTQTARPFMVSAYTIQFQLLVWQILLLLFLLIALTVLAFISFQNYTIRISKRGKIDPKQLSLPTERQDRLSTVHIISAIVDARKKKITNAQLADLVLMAVNQNLLKASVAAEVLDEFGYILVSLSNGHFTLAEKGLKK